ncbi:MAG: hypothetical protein Q4D89_10920 [Arachnia propionica]|uniref:hypothetical protein n=1 Tax=Arachnia propionica TaxID=1750 RepID=UPI0026FDFAB5|nr:hypothetical protein [Arachnia propionica]
MTHLMTTSGLRRHIAQLSRELPPDEVVEVFVEATRARVAAGLAPQAELGDVLRRLAASAGRDGEAAVQVLLREVLGLPGIGEASINFWRRHLDDLRILGRDEVVREMIAGIVPTQFTPEEWLEVLEASGVADDLRSGRIDATTWVTPLLERLFSRPHGSQYRFAEFLSGLEFPGHLRLVADAWHLDLDVLDALAAARAPFSSMGLTGRHAVADWAAREPRRPLDHLAASNWQQDFSDEEIEDCWPVIVAHDGARRLLRRWAEPQLREKPHPRELYWELSRLQPLSTRAGGVVVGEEVGRLADHLDGPALLVRALAQGMPGVRCVGQVGLEDAARLLELSPTTSWFLEEGQRIDASPEALDVAAAVVGRERAADVVEMAARINRLVVDGRAQLEGLTTGFGVTVRSDLAVWAFPPRHPTARPNNRERVLAAGEALASGRLPELDWWEPSLTLASVCPEVLLAVAAGPGRDVAEIQGAAALVEACLDAGLLTSRACAWTFPNEPPVAWKGDRVAGGLCVGTWQVDGEEQALVLARDGERPDRVAGRPVAEWRRTRVDDPHQVVAGFRRLLAEGPPSWQPSPVEELATATGLSREVAALILAGRVDGVVPEEVRDLLGLTAAETERAVAEVARVDRLLLIGLLSAGAIPGNPVVEGPNVASMIEFWQWHHR